MATYESQFGLKNQQTEKNYPNQTIFRHYENAHVLTLKRPSVSPTTITYVGR